jgi:hypothetical protein
VSNLQIFFYPKSNTIQTPFKHHSNTILTLFYNNFSNTIRTPFAIRTPFEHRSSSIRPLFHHTNTITGGMPNMSPEEEEQMKKMANDCPTQ